MCVIGLPSQALRVFALLDCILFYHVWLLSLVGLLLSEKNQKESGSGGKGSWVAELGRMERRETSQDVFCESRIYFE